MGFFGVASVGELDSAPTIERCHLNLWTLGGLVGYRVCCFDVGLAIRAGREPVGKIQLGIPAVTSDSPERALDSLLSQMKDPTVAGLIFARESVLNDGHLNLDGDPFRILDIDRPNCTMATQPRDRHFSLWTLNLVGELKPEEAGYLRVRFHIRSPGRLWLWQRSLLAKDCAIADLRVSDEREAHSVADISAFTSRLLPLLSLNAFVIAPASLSPSVTTPEPSYVRGLEGSVWERYLGRRTDLRRNQKFLVHRWQAQSGSVTAERPFRAFLQLERRRSLLPSWSDLVPVIIALLIAAGLFELDLRNLGWIDDATDAVGSFLFSGFPSPSGVYAVAALVLFGLALRDRLREVVQSTRGLAGRIDRWVYSRNLRYE